MADEAGPSSPTAGAPRPPPQPLTLKRIQGATWRLLDDPSSSQAAKYLSTVMMVVILLSIGSFTVASNPEDTWWSNVWVNHSTGNVIADSRIEHNPPGSYRNDGPSRLSTELEENRSPFYEIETFCIMVFTAEYLLRLLASPEGPGVINYLINPANVIDLVSILPWYIELIFSGGGISVLGVLRLIRLTRITRVFKMSKQFQGLMVLFATLRKSAAALLMLFAFMAIFSIFFATLIFSAEAGVYDPIRQQYIREDGSASPFESIPMSIWWTIVTMTTVGYGDQVPVTVGGKIVAIVTMFCGLVVLSLPITIIGANFDEEYRIQKKLKADAAAEAQRLAKERGPTESAAGKLGSIKFRGLGSPSLSPSKSKAGVDAAAASEAEDQFYPIKLIQKMIKDAHYELSEEIEDLLVKYENKLRKDIKEVLRKHASGIDLRASPLEQSKTELNRASKS